MSDHNDQGSSDEFEKVNGRSSPLPELSSHFKLIIKPCLEQIDQLRSLGLDKKIELPAIAVIGDQSVGKSSVLEGISGIAFPRGNTTVTRCPLQLAMRARSDDKWECSIKWIGKDGVQQMEEISTPQDIGPVITKVQDKLINETNQLVTDSLIQLRIESKDCPDLTLIDLPGIARYSEKYKDQDVATQTKNIIQKYIKRNEVIILLVMPLKQDIETMEALKLAKEVDPEGVRTIGVLTFPDMMNKGDEEDKLRLAMNMASPKLTKGFVTVKCRNQKSIVESLSLANALADEKRFFEDHPQFSRLPQQMRGIPALSAKLTNELFRKVQADLPMLVEAIEKQINECKQLHFELGGAPPADPNALSMELCRILMEIGTTFREVATGSVSSGKDLLIVKCRQLFASFTQDIDRLTTRLNDPKVLMEIQTLLGEQRGPELPVCVNNWEPVRIVVQKYLLTNLPDLAESLVADVHRNVQVALQETVNKICMKFPLLGEIIITEGLDLLEVLLEKAKKDMEIAIQKERYVYMEDATYLERYTMNLCERVEEAIQLAAANQSTNQQIAALSNKSANYHDRKAIENRISDLKLKLRQLNQSQHSAVNVYQEAANDTMLIVKSYATLATNRIKDNIPLSIIHFLFYTFSNELINKLTLLLQERESLVNLLTEDVQITMQRDENQRNLAALKEARQKLVKATAKKYEVLNL